MYIYEDKTIEQTIEKFETIDYQIFLMIINDYTRTLKGEALEKLNDLTAKIGVYEFLLSEAEEKRWWKKVKGLYHLGFYPLNARFEKIIRDCAIHKSIDVRAAVAVSLANYIEDERVDLLFQLFYDQDVTVRIKAREGLLKFGQKLYEPLLEKINAEKNKEYLIELLDMMAQIKDERFVYEIDKYLHSDDFKIIGSAIEIAANIEYPVSVELQEKIFNSSDNEVKKTLLKNFYIIGDILILYKISTFMFDREWIMRYLAAVSLYKSGEAGQAVLRKIILENNDRYATDMAKMVYNEQSGSKVY